MFGRLRNANQIERGGLLLRPSEPFTRPPGPVALHVRAPPWLPSSPPGCPLSHPDPPPWFLLLSTFARDSTESFVNSPHELDPLGAGRPVVQTGVASALTQ